MLIKVENWWYLFANSLFHSNSLLSKEFEEVHDSHLKVVSEIEFEEIKAKR